MHFVILIALFMTHAVIGRMWWERKGYPYWGFLVICGVVGGAGGIISQVIGGTNGNLAEYIFLIVVILSYIPQLMTMKKE